MPGRIVERLRSIPIFDDLSDADIESIVQTGISKTYKKNEVVCKEDESDNEVYIILDGVVSVWKSFGAADAVFLGSYESGSICGEIGVIEQIPRSATIVAAAEMEIFIIDGLKIREVLNKNSRIAWVFLHSLAGIVIRNTSELTRNLQLQNTALKNAHTTLKAQQESMLRNERLAQLGKMSSLLAHDLRGPLSSLQLLEHLLRSRASDEQFVLTISDRLKVQIQHLEAFIEDLLDFVSGSETLQFSSVSIQSFVMNLVDRWRSLCDEEKLTLECETKGEAIALIDATRIDRMLHNIVENAIKASKAETKIRISSTLSAGEWIITVQDFGVGMTKGVTEQIFDPFFTRFRGGNGLGMVSVQKIVHAHGGNIAVTSEENKGTTVRVSIPLTYADA